MNPKSQFYYKNNLRISNFFGNYKNINQNWKKYYNHTIVVPITQERESNHVTLKSVIGFVCIDNKSKGFKRSDIRTTQMFSDMMYCVIILVGRDRLDNYRSVRHGLV